MSNGFIKIDIEDSYPVISMEYDTLEIFKDLMFFVLSPSGMELFCETIQKDLINNNRTDELKILDSIIKLLGDQDEFHDEEFISPSSFK